MMNPNKMRHYLNLTVILLIGTVLISGGCARKEGTNKKEIRYAARGRAGEMDKMNKIVSAFEKKHPQIKVKTEFMAGDIAGKLLTEMAAGMAPDVMFLFDTAIPEFGERGV